MKIYCPRSVRNSYLHLIGSYPFPRSCFGFILNIFRINFTLLWMENGNIAWLCTMALRVQYFTTQIYFTQSKFQFTQSKIHFTQLEIHFTQLEIHFTQLGIHFAQLKFSPSGPYFCYHQSLICYKDWLLSVLFTMYRHVMKFLADSKTTRNAYMRLDISQTLKILLHMDSN